MAINYQRLQLHLVMIKYLLTPFLLMFFLASTSLLSQGQNLEKNVMIRIVQEDSRRLDDFETTVKLKKKGFKVQVLLQGLEGVFVFASINDSIYRFNDSSVIQDFKYLKLLELREEDKFNTNKELNISETGWSYWFYNDKTEWHSFNRTTQGMGKDRRVCTKAIKQLYDVSNRSIIKLRSLTTPLYLFFVAVKDYDQQGKPITELLRRKVKIEWDEND